MKAIWGVLLAGLLLIGPAVAKKRVDPYALTPAEVASANASKVLMSAKLGTAYSDLRRQAVDAGYRPVAASNGTDTSRCDFELKGVCKTYMETLFCKAGTPTYCRFLFEYEESWVVIGTQSDGDTQRLTDVKWLSLKEKNDLQEQVYSLNGR